MWTSRRLRSACSTPRATAPASRRRASRSIRRWRRRLRERARASRRQRRRACAIRPSRRCWRASRAATMWCSARCCSAACTAAKAPIGRSGCSSTRCRCASGWASRASAEACGARTSCSPSCCGMSTPRWRWRSDAAASLLPRRCSPRCSTIDTARAASDIGRRERAWEGIESLYAEERTNYPLTLSVDDLGDGFLLTAQTQSPLDPERICAYMRVALEGLVEALEQAPQTPTRTIDILPQDERHRLLVEWNDTAADYPQDRLLHELFEAQAARAPEAVALVFEGAQLTYGELNAQSQSAGASSARAGRRSGCDRRPLRGALLRDDRRALLGVLKAGGAYLPLDPDYPQRRLAYMIADAAPALVLTQERLRERLPETVATLRLDADWETIARRERGEPRAARDAAEPRLCHLHLRLHRKAERRRRRRMSGWSNRLHRGCRRRFESRPRRHVLHADRLVASTSRSGRLFWPLCEARAWSSPPRRHRRG